MKAICGYCETVVGENAVEHFRERHPAMEWDLRKWPDDEQVLIEPCPTCGALFLHEHGCTDDH